MFGCSAAAAAAANGCMPVRPLMPLMPMLRAGSPLTFMFMFKFRFTVGKPLSPFSAPNGETTVAGVAAAAAAETEPAPAPAPAPAPPGEIAVLGVPSANCDCGGLGGCAAAE